MELSGLGRKLIHYLSRQFDLPLQDAFRPSVPKLKGLCNVSQAGSTAAPPFLRQLCRCISWWHTINDQLQSLVKTLLSLLFGGDRHALNIAIETNLPNSLIT